MARVFSAVEVESNELQQELVEVRNRFDLGFNPVEKDKFHVTLQFFQDIEQRQIETIKSSMEKVNTDSFSSKVRGVGSFPSNSYIRVIWAGVESKSFQKLYSQVSDHDVEDDHDHDFKPHITFLRVEDISSQRKKKIQKMLKEFGDHDFGNLNVERVKLFESELKPSGSVYRQLHVKEL